MFDLQMLGATDAATLSLTERLAEPFLYSMYRQPMLVTVLIGATLGLIGSFVLLRRMALIGDALSHAVLPGVVIAFMFINAWVGALEGAAGIWGLFIGALLAGLLTSAGINLVARHSRIKEDAAIGIVFTAMFALGVILISSLPQGTHFDLKCFLFGEVLAIQREDLITTLIVAPSILLIVVLFYRPLKLISFDPQMAAATGLPVQFLHYLLMGCICATVVAALRSVGVIMSVAMLITPAAVAYQLTNRFSVMLVISAVVGGISALGGFLLAFAMNLPPGPAMVAVVTVIFLGTMLLAPEYGAVAKALRRRKVRAHILEEDVLKSLGRLGERASIEAMRSQVGIPVTAAQTEAALRQLVTRGLVLQEAGAFALTEAGRHRAEGMIRSHRLWETYLAENLPVSGDQVHEAAERLEHAHDLAEELASELGNPAVDPHGEPIPAPPPSTQK